MYLLSGMKENIQETYLVLAINVIGKNFIYKNVYFDVQDQDIGLLVHHGISKDAW